jgi:hypothetical protein
MRHVDGFLTQLAQEDLGLPHAVVYVDKPEQGDESWVLENPGASPLGLGINFKSARASLRRLIKAKK